jgi:hypothetical protein
MSQHRRWSVAFALAVGFFAWLPVGRADPAATTSPGQQPARTVELFAAMETGELAVKLIPRDAKKARIFIENKTQQPLNVKLPSTFAGVPVLAQFGAPMAGRPNMAANTQTPQTIGGPMGQQPGNQQNMRPGGFNFNIPPEKVGEVRVDCVCLEYGKPNPRAAIPYKLVPTSSVASEATVAMLEEYGRGGYSHNAAQAAAWHLASGLSWEKLAKLPGTLIAEGVNDPYFSKRDMKDAEGLVAVAEKASPSTTPAGKPTTETKPLETAASQPRE